jgi:hypothetical protein
LTVRVWVTGLDPVTLTLVGERLIPETGLPLPSTRERFTVPVKPFWGVMVRVVWPLAPCCTVRLVGLRERVKSRGGLLGHAVRTTLRISRTRIKAFLITLSPFEALGSLNIACPLCARWVSEPKPFLSF